MLFDMVLLFSVLLLSLSQSEWSSLTASAVVGAGQATYLGVG
jgi:hypothetical protein